jgi:hypothetical protein
LPFEALSGLLLFASKAGLPLVGLASLSEFSYQKL